MLIVGDDSRRVNIRFQFPLLGSEADGALETPHCNCTFFQFPLLGSIMLRTTNSEIANSFQFPLLGS